MLCDILVPMPCDWHLDYETWFSLITSAYLTSFAPDGWKHPLKSRYWQSSQSVMSIFHVNLTCSRIPQLHQWIWTMITYGQPRKAYLGEGLQRVYVSKNTHHVTWINEYLRYSMLWKLLWQREPSTVSNDCVVSVHLRTLWEFWACALCMNSTCLISNDVGILGMGRLCALYPSGFLGILCLWACRILHL